MPHIRWFSRQDAPMLVAANRCPLEAIPFLAGEIGVPPAKIVALDVSERTAVRVLVIGLLEAALSDAAPTAVSLEIQARLG
jgi:hypothetical protein